jgi:aryl-alcohol dehydrogenase-like predicted oxidoreductase
MKYRRLGKTGLKLSEISLGTWQLGEGWGSVSEKDAISSYRGGYRFRRQFLR